ncbi:hypothetical protein Rleg9DRAFT_1701 [Rhizobium leguminosarum bv. trifolii WSM597]|uniref:Phage gp6-like head-tail connector protein n=1 Tax=Rhizobium leguminosarum bv. trifolii WSM597 TaxID=754764 RepID=I9N867_RHILT|nr:hypothetical protein [Rhizobium leguminosarum]EJB02887.1 hypothetical protein Rleg9DRAFT_1701 [Rhizobium leguminosarum bv. trifolii WSM597]
MRQNFTVTVPTTSPSLLTLPQLRAVAGLAPGDTSQDIDLAQLGLQISAEIAVACNVASDGMNVPSLKAETIAETIWNEDCDGELLLARGFISSATVLELSTSVASGDFFINRAAGILSRANSGRPWRWQVGTIEVTYVAGFSDDKVPADLVGVASDLARLRLSSAARDPLVKSESIEVPDVQTRRLDFWIGAIPGTELSPVPPDLLARLGAYRNVVVA